MICRHANPENACRAVPLALAAAAFFTFASHVSAEPSAADLEFFEKKVRPVLVQNCQGCHGAAKQKGGLRLDSQVGLMAGGEVGPVVAPGKPAESRLIVAIGYGDADLKMPPKGRLPDAVIADLTHWVELGAPWPEESAPLPVPAAASAKTFNLEQRRRAHWAWQPIKPTAPPAVGDSNWPRNDIDRFILAKLEASNLHPAHEADRATLLRRVSFDLIGLPPKPEEIDAFLADPAPDAWEKVVDRLLASPQFGERWARHWLDLVRYAETYGHEQDYPIHHAWRYRDYVIRALNEDVPYDRLLAEHIAGDLLPNPRLNPTLGFNESIIATGFWHMHQATHAPVDARQDEADRIDNQIDVLGKAFLGVTLACARCHDHKFDAISTRDYYALGGILKSSRRQVAYLDPLGKIASGAAQLRDLRARAERAQAAALRSASAFSSAAASSTYLLAASEIHWTADPAQEARLKSLTQATSADLMLDPARLEKLARALADPALDAPDHPLHLWRVAGGAGSADDFARRLADAGREASAQLDAANAERSASVVFAEFKGSDFGNWTATGEAFGAGPTQSGARIGPAGPTWPAGWAHSGLDSPRLKGVLRSPTFTIERKNIHYHVAGDGGLIRLVVDGFPLREFNGLLFEDTQIEIKTGGAPTWRTQTKDIGKYIGHRAYIELIDDGDGWLAVDEIRFSDDPAPKAAPNPITARLLAGLGEGSAGSSRSDLARAYATLAKEGFAQWGEAETPATPWAAWLVDHGLVDLAPAADELNQVSGRMREIEAALPEPMRVLAMADGTGEDMPVYIRGSHRTPGELAPRRFMEAISGADQPPLGEGSGRLELARRILDPDDPLPARVMVNRIWLHLFGRGIVATPDNFGTLGEPPTHPELLDYLADRFRREGWSIKGMIRAIVTSAAYRMSSRPADAAFEERDPGDALLHRMRARRLEGEAIRDAVLAISGRLDPAMFGEGPLVYLTPFMDGRNRPQSGPLDGAGRRSVYLQVRRNFLSTMLIAFDTPIPDTCVGRRNVSNVPAQALIMMNDPFVVEQAGIWARRELAREAPSPAARIERMWLEALGRKPSQGELYRMLVFLRAQGSAYAGLPEPGTANERVWADLAHAIFMLKEFIFLA